jgi:membrane fusion protein (multidrug efflux system)
MKRNATLLIFNLMLLIFAAQFAMAQGRGGPAQPPSVFVTEVREKTIYDTIEALGNLRANETVHLNTQVTEKVTAIKFEDGQRVKAGDILVEMTSTEESALLAEEQSRVDEALRQVERLEPLIKQGAASKSTLDEKQREYETAKARLDAIRSQLTDRIITAPFDGVLGLRNISVGVLLQPGMMITTLDDDSVMKLDFDVPSLFLPVIKEGLPIKVRTKAYPDKIFEGKISSIDSQIDTITRSIKVRAIIPNADKLLKPGLLMVVELYKNERKAFVIPEQALLMQGSQSYVYVAGEKDGKAMAIKRDVITGARQPGEVEITKGLNAGEKVITHGVAKVSEGDEIMIRAEEKNNETLDMLLNEKDKGSQ